MKHTMASIVLGFSALSLPALASANTYFSWDADSPATSAGQCAKFLGVFDAVERIEGKASVRFDISGASQTQLGCDVNPIALGTAFGKKLYYRWWMKIAPDYRWGSADRKIKAMRVASDNSELFTVYLRAGDLQLSPIDESKDYIVLKHDFNPQTNSAVAEWHEYVLELHQQSSASTADGGGALYVDGELVAQQDRANYYAVAGAWTQRWGAFMTRPLPQLNDGSAGGVIWVDNIALDDTWNSTFKALPMSPSQVRAE